MSSTSAVLDAPNSASKPNGINNVDKAHRHSCPHCPYRTYTTKTIKEHVQSSHIIAKAFKCPHCTYSTNACSSLPAHLKLHENTDWQPPQNAVVPVSASPERAMPLPQRRPLSNIGNESSVSNGENKTSHCPVPPPPRRANSAAASIDEATVAKSTVALDKNTVALRLSRTEASRLRQTEEQCFVLPEEYNEVEPKRSIRSLFEAGKKRQKKEKEGERMKNDLSDASPVHEFGLRRKRSGGKKEEKEVKTPELGRRKRSRGRMEKKEEEKEEKKEVTQPVGKKEAKFDSLPHKADCHLDTSINEDEEEKEESDSDKDQSNDQSIIHPKEETDLPLALVKEEKEVTVDAVKKEEVEVDQGGEEREVKKEVDGEDELDVSSLDAAIAEAEENAKREKMRAVIQRRMKKEEEMEEEKKRGPPSRKRVRFAPLPEKHHALHMPTKRRKMSGEKEGQGMRSTVPRDLSTMFSPFNVPSTSRSIFSPERNGRNTSIAEAMRARASQLAQKEKEEMEGVEKDGTEIKMPFRMTPLLSSQRPPIDEFESDEEGEQEEERKVEAPLPPVNQVKKTTVKARKPAKTTVTSTTVSLSENGSRAKKRVAPGGKTTPVKTAQGAKAVAAAARKKEQARVAKLARLKRDLARRLEKSTDRRNAAAKAEVEEEDRHWRTTREVTPLERIESSGQERLFSWPEIHNARVKMAMEVEARKEGEKRAESLHSASSSAYLARTVEVKKRSEVDGLAKVVKSFNRARSPPLDWSYEEKETEEALHPTVPADFVAGGQLRCL